MSELSTCCRRSRWRNRCRGCGHRQERNGIPPRQTRERWPWFWVIEPFGRVAARLAGGGADAA